MFKKIIGYVIAVTFLTTLATASENNQIPMNFGIYVAPGLNLPTQSIMLLNINGVPYSSVEGKLFWGIAGGLTGNFPVGKDIVINANIGYNGIYGKAQSGDTEIESMIHYFEVNPMARFYNLFSDVYNFYLTGGFEFSIPLSSSLKAGGDAQSIDQHAFRPALAAGVGYTFPLNESTFFSTDLTFRFPFTDVSNNTEYQNWTVPQVRLNLALTFGFEKEVPIDTVVKFVPELKTGFKSVTFYNNDGSVAPLEKIKVEEIQYQELFPLVPSIFCDKNQDKPDVKNQIMSGSVAAGEFKIEDLNPDALAINKSTLDIIGLRMEKNANATLKIIGTKDVKSETLDPQISLKRAEWAKNYLSLNYDIEENRIEATGSGLPANPSSQRVEDGQAENRRIEFYSESKDILEPIIIEKERVRMAEPAYVEFVPFVYSNEKITEWNLEIMQGGKILRRFNGEGTPDSVLWNIYPNELAASDLSVDYVLNAKSESGLESMSEGTVAVDYLSLARKASRQKADSTISKFSLIVFNFDSPNISDVDKEILIKNVIPSITHKSIVKIFGYSDRIGEEKYNQKLALERAENARKILQASAPNAKYEVYGVGESIAIYDNNHPIGRQLSRTVQIYVITQK